MARTIEPDPLTITLSNGLSVAYKRVKGPVECCGVAIMAGSRDETTEKYGLAHFVEHTIFKGTERRRSYHVINRMETVGGELNAYTTKEETYVYAVAPAGNCARAIDLIADLVKNSSFPSKELDKEREVVIDEINSYLDSPADAAYDEFEDMIFAGSQLGHNILGSPGSVNSLRQADCRSWVENFYTPGRMVFFYAGPAAPNTVWRLAEKHFQSLHTEDNAHQRVIPPTNSTFDITRNIDAHQAHTIIGCRIGPLTAAERLRTSLCNNILGGNGMNSRLNVALRERHGLVYTVDSSLTSYSDATLWSCYFGCDTEDVEKCKKLISRELRHLAENPLTPRALSAAKRQFMGQLTLSNASVENRALSLGRIRLRGEKYMSRTEIDETLKAVSSHDIADTARLLLKTGLSSLTLA